MTQTSASLILNHEAALRLAVFVACFALFAVIEIIHPARPIAEPRLRRWGRNLTLLLLNTAILRLAFPLLAVGAALSAQAHGVGLFRTLAVPPILAGALSVIALDGLLYAQHRLLHMVPLLWRLHRLHHLDAGLDVTTAVRFHPLEIIFSMALKMAAVVVLGAPAESVVVFEILLNAGALFSHSNLSLGRGLDSALSQIVITPAVHRMHHSTRPEQHNRNFGFFLSIWDRLLGTFIDPAIKGPLEIGLGFTKESGRLSLPALIIDPFLADRSEN